MSNKINTHNIPTFIHKSSLKRKAGGSRAIDVKNLGYKQMQTLRDYLKKILLMTRYIKQFAHLIRQAHRFILNDKIYIPNDKIQIARQKKKMCKHKTI